MTLQDLKDSIVTNLSKDKDGLDKPYLIHNKKHYTKSEIIRAIKDNTDLGDHMINTIMNLTVDLLNLESSKYFQIKQNQVKTLINSNLPTRVYNAFINHIPSAKTHYVKFLPSYTIQEICDSFSPLQLRINLHNLSDIGIKSIIQVLIDNDIKSPEWEYLKEQVKLNPNIKYLNI